MSGIGGIICFDNNSLSIPDSLKLKSALQKRVHDEFGQATGKNFFYAAINYALLLNRFMKHNHST